jgi:hypothetical protein
MTNRTYQAPKLVDLGKVADLTQVGLTNPGGDAKSGSVLHSNGR